MSATFEFEGRKLRIEDNAIYSGSTLVRRIKNAGSLVVDKHFLAVDGQVVHFAPRVSNNFKAEARERARAANKPNSDVVVGQGIGHVQGTNVTFNF